MKSSGRGFTLVELTIAIVVIGILAAIVAINWSSATSNAQDKAREHDIRQWAATFELYKSRFIVYPALPTSDGTSGAVKYCLGSFAESPYNGKCARYADTGSKSIDASASSSLLTEVAKVGNVPKNGGPALQDTFVGPYAYIEQSTDSGTGAITVDAYFIGFFTKPCSTINGFNDATADINDPSKKLYPAVNAIMAGYTGSAYICYLPSSLTYTPG